MTYSEASNTIRTQFDKTSAQLNRIDWAKLKTALYNIAVFVGVVCYLSYLAVRATIKAVRTAHSLWVKYEVTAKIKAAITALRPGMPTLLTESRKQVEKVYATFSNRVQQIANSMASDYRSIREQIQPVAKG